MQITNDYWVNLDRVGVFHIKDGISVPSLYIAAEGEGWNFNETKLTQSLRWWRNWLYAKEIENGMQTVPKHYAPTL